MKKLALLFLILWSFPGFALFMGNPIEPNVVPTGCVQDPDGLFSVKFGYEGDFVFDNKLKAYNGSSGRVDSFSYQINQAVVTFGLFERVEAYGSIGAMATSFSYLAPLAYKQLECTTHDQMTWGMGGRALLWEWGRIGLGMQGSYQWAGAHLKSTTLDGAFIPTKRAMMSYYQWQIGFGASYRVEFFVPYIGVKYMSTRVELFRLNPDLELNTVLFRMRNRTWIGTTLGCTLAASKAIDLTVEVEFFDESALSLFGNIRF